VEAIEQPLGIGVAVKIEVLEGMVVAGQECLDP
jgi:hypothetical protein